MNYDVNVVVPGYNTDRGNCLVVRQHGSREFMITDRWAPIPFLYTQVRSGYFTLREFFNGVMFLSPLNPQMDMLCSIALVLSVAFVLVSLFLYEFQFFWLITHFWLVSPQDWVRSLLKVIFIIFWDMHWRNFAQWFRFWERMHFMVTPYIFCPGV